MPGLLIKDFPPELHRRLREAAARHRRSMTRQALVLLEQGLAAPSQPSAGRLPEPVRPRKRVSARALAATVRHGRDADDAGLFR